MERCCLLYTSRTELVETGYLRRRKQAGGFREKKYKPEPYKYTLTNGMTVLVGRNNKENDILTLKTAGNKDLWLHTKDIPGSHVIVQCGGVQPDEAATVSYTHLDVYKRQILAGSLPFASISRRRFSGK